MKKTTSFFTKSTLSLGIVAVLSAFSLAEAPLSINYQGKLTNSSGEPTNVEVTVKFKFYNDLTLSGADHLLWSPDPIKVTPVNGVFSVPIPVNATLFSGTEVYLGVSVNEGAEMSPRQQLWAVPYALAVGANSVGSGELKNDAVTSGKIQDGAVSGGLGGKISAGTIDSVDLKDSSVSSAKIQTGAVSGGLGGKISAGTIDSVDLKDSSVSSAKIQTGAVSGGLGGKISAGTIDSVDLKDSSVSSTKIQTGAVTKVKLYGPDFIDVYKTKGDNRLVVSGPYETGACKGVGASDDFYDCDGNCTLSSPHSCSAASDATKVGRLLALP